MDIAEILYKFIITIFTAIKSSAFTEDFIAVLLMIIGIGVIGVITTSITLYIINGGKKIEKTYEEKVIEDIKSMLDNFDDLSNEDLDNIVKILKALKK